jgi:hypothetical protein
MGEGCSIITNKSWECNTVVSGRLNLTRDLKRTNQIVSFERTRHLIGLWTIPVRVFFRSPETTVSTGRWFHR